ncbi:MAG: hypothetical protein PF572_06915 [Patescibacteria group bacterium]|jgi:hypothetical protein|nr:hypothetical protein [Patescibacteria group bacterium]
MFKLYIISISIFLILSLYWILKIVKSSFWLKKNQILNFEKKRFPIKFMVLIPVLDEGKIIENTVRYFSDLVMNYPGSKIILITTEKEFDINNAVSEKNTVVVSKKIKEKFKNIEVIHYPLRDGNMASQVNYAVHSLEKKLPKNSTLLFSLYNADSRPDIKSFEWVASENNRNSSTQVYQQYGNYLGNIGSILNRNLFSRSILISGSSWQNRWSLGFEIPHSLEQYKVSKKSVHLYPLNYCIGHGLFFTKNIFDKLGGFSEGMHNEDAIFGLKLSYLREEIKPIPYFDLSFSPDNLKGLFFQKASWFFGPVQAFDYYNVIKKDKNTIKRSLLFILSLKLFSHAIYWTIGPLVFTLIFYYSVLQNSLLYYLLFLLTFFLYLVLPNYLSYICTNPRNICKLKILSYIFIGSIPFYFIHGVAGWMSFFKYIASKTTGLKIKKRKTIMFD